MHKLFNDMRQVAAQATASQWQLQRVLGFNCRFQVCFVLDSWLQQQAISAKNLVTLKGELNPENNMA